MKKHLLLLSIPFLVVGLMMLTSFGGDETSDYPSGSPAGYTGSPYDGKDCTNCHNGTSSFVADWITSDIPPEGYTPGTDYTITVTITGNGRKGFEVSPHDAGGNLLGVLTAGAGSKLVGSGKYITQSSGVNSNPATWNFTWTAPVAGTGEVTFWGAFCVSEPVTKTSTMVVQENSAQPLSVNVTADPVNVHIGDSSHLEAAVSGGTGSYTYTWTSNPPGFTSSLQNPWVTPQENAFYIVEVSDGVTTETDSVEVTVFGVGVDEPSSGIALSVFPNPVASSLTLTLSGSEISSVEITICSMAGKPLIHRTVNSIHGAASVQIDLVELPAGSYLLQIRDGINQAIKKIIKSN